MARLRDVLEGRVQFGACNRLTLLNAAQHTYGSMSLLRPVTRHENCFPIAQEHANRSRS